MEDSEILMSINRDLYIEMKKKHMETYNKNEKLMVWADMLGAIFSQGGINWNHKASGHHGTEIDHRPLMTVFTQEGDPAAIGDFFRNQGLAELSGPVPKLLIADIHKAFFLAGIVG